MLVSLALTLIPKLIFSMCPLKRALMQCHWCHQMIPEADWPYVIRVQRNVGLMGLPLVKPPYRRITAIDSQHWEHTWKTPSGKGPANHPALAHLNLPDLGSSFSDYSAEGGIQSTKTWLITHLAQKDEIDPDADGSILGCI